MPRGKNRCYVCLRKHDLGFLFPPDMPYEFRWCCACNRYARFLSKHPLEEVIEIFKKCYSRLDRITYTKRSKKINNLINVV